MFNYLSLRRHLGLTITALDSWRRLVLYDRILCVFWFVCHNVQFIFGKGGGSVKAGSVCFLQCLTFYGNNIYRIDLPHSFTRFAAILTSYHFAKCTSIELCLLVVTYQFRVFYICFNQVSLKRISKYQITDLSLCF